MSQDPQGPHSPRSSAGFSASLAARFSGRLGALLGWALALAALAAGWLGYGWPGVVLAITVIVFWLLLQFSRALRTLRQASGRPVGQVDNAVMLHARLRRGQSLAEVLRLTRSLGQPLHDAAAAGERTGAGVREAFAWHDAGGDAVQVELRDGRVTHWQLVRAAGGAPVAGS